MYIYDSHNYLSIYLSKIGEIVIQIYIFNEFKKINEKIE